MPRHGSNCWNNLKKFWQCSVQTSNWCHKVELFLLTQPGWPVDQLWGHGNWRKTAPAESGWKGQSIAEIRQHLQPNDSQSCSSSPPQCTGKTHESNVLRMYISSQMFVCYRCMCIKYITSTVGSPDNNLFICFNIKTEQILCIFRNHIRSFKHISWAVDQIPLSSQLILRLLIYLEDQHAITRCCHLKCLNYLEMFSNWFSPEFLIYVFIFNSFHFLLNFFTPYKLLEISLHYWVSGIATKVHYLFCQEIRFYILEHPNSRM